MKQYLMGMLTGSIMVTSIFFFMGLEVFKTSFGVGTNKSASKHCDLFDDEIALVPKKTSH